MKASSLFLAGGMMLALAQAAMANATTTLVQVGTTVINSTSYNIYDLKVTEDSVWTNQHLSLNLTQGSIYYDTSAFSSNPPGTPQPAFFSFDPNLQNETFFTIPQGYPNAPFTSTQGSTASFAADSFSATALSVDWYRASGAGSDNAPGTYVVAQLTLSANALGTYGGTAFDTATAGTGVAYQGAIGAAAPEPASLAVLGLGVVGLMTRKRRRA